MDNKKATIYKVYKSMDKALNKLIDNSAKDYLKPLENQAWYPVALKGYKDISKNMLELLQKYAKEYGKVIKENQLFNKNKVKKDDDDQEDDTSYDDLDYDVIVDEDTQSILEDIKEKIIEELEEFFEEHIGNDLTIAAAEEIAKDLGITFNFNKFDVFTRDYLLDKKIEWATQVAKTTEERVKKLLVKGFEQGLGIYDIADLIHQDGVFSYSRAETIARTEIISSCNYTDNAMWSLDDNIIGKEWSSTGDGRTRLTHSSANGQKVPKDKPFIVGGYKLMHPGDSSLGASASEILSCRCTMFPIFEGESLKSDTIYDDEDVGTVEWLKRQDEEFQVTYLGNKNKLELFKHDKLKNNDLLKPMDEIVANMTEKDGIIKETKARSIREISGVSPYEKVDLYHTGHKSYDKRRVFDKNGKVEYDFDLNVHKNLKQHKIAPHIHIWDNGKKEKGYKIPTLDHIKNNKDIFLKIYDEEYYKEYLKAYELQDEGEREEYLEKITRSWWYGKLHPK